MANIELVGVSRQTLLDCPGRLLFGKQMAVTFVDNLPEHAGLGGRPVSSELREFTTALRQNPGRWALYPGALTARSMNVTRQAINTAQAAAFRDGGYRAAVRRGQLYVQYTDGAA